MVEVLKSGLYDTIQDLGRFGVQEYGIPFSGAMDMLSAQMANKIIGNNAHDAVLEITLIGPWLKFHVDSIIAICGADLNAMINGIGIKLNTQVVVKNGDTLSFGKQQKGCRTYLAVKNGFQTEMVMNSRSMYKDVTPTSTVKKNDVLPIQAFENKTGLTNSSIKIKAIHFDSEIIEGYRGQEFSRLSETEQNSFLNTDYSISKDSNRMAYQFEQRISNTITPIITSAVLPGTIQLTPSGQLMVLMRDCQTTGGYPRIFQLTEESINKLSQKTVGQKIRFKCKDW
ncbi:biotin-dependent carboxyltransferase family protein [Psychroserpens sp. XS_ASV72]|uniref:5-oxoprolinase subunit C family protein n=1 Tax=Psychroserpens sp. XS_ASV72 TaxID=3241293 RepID=UPI00351148AB